jgi:hypothetical protein
MEVLRLNRALSDNAQQLSKEIFDYESFSFQKGGAA